MRFGFLSVLLRKGSCRAVLSMKSGLPDASLLHCCMGHDSHAVQP